MSIDTTTGTEIPDEVWGVPEVAAFLGFSDQTIRAQCKKGVLPHYKVGRTFKFKRRSIEAWVRQQESVAGPPTPDPVPVAG
jgi:excisionase family DNA binding protein